MNKIEIGKLKIKIGDVEVELTLAEARNLQSVLNDLFGTTQPVHIRWDRPYPGSPVTT